MTVEIIPIDNEDVQAAAEGDDRFNVRVRNLEAWPDQEFICHFEYSDHSDRWVWELEHTRLGTVIPKTRCVLDRRYDIWPYVMFQFTDRHDTEVRVSRDNLGDRVVLAVYPGPLGGHFLEGAGISSEREEIILRRYWYDPVG